MNLQRLKLESEFRKESLPDSVLKAFRNTMSKLVTIDETTFTTNLTDFNTLAVKKPINSGVNNVDDVAVTEFSDISDTATPTVSGQSAQHIFNTSITDSIAGLGFQQEAAAPASHT